ncbi:MAG: MCE family protein [Elusimicrobia bacterium]|nr:MCE family protein [Elusimicrobiota bacterium]
MFSLEAKVGAFVVTGLALMGIAIFLLGDYTLEKRYVLNATFHDVANLNKNAPVKLSGVEIGQVKDIELRDGLARVVLAVRKGVVIYKDADFTIGSTGIIGSKYLQIDQGHPSSGELHNNDTVVGSDPVSIEKALAKALNSMQAIMNTLNEEGPRGSLAGNLKETVANLREMTANLNDLIETTKPNMEKAMARTDAITDKLDQLLTKSNQMMAGLATDKGAVGALLHDEKVKSDVKETIASVKEAASTAKDVFGRITQFRVFWNYDWRYEGAIKGSHADAGLKIYPRDKRYYYLGGSNLMNVSDATRHGNDYTQANRVDGLMGWEWGPLDVAVGSIRSAGGARVTVTPFYKDSIGKHFSLLAQGYDFGRNRTINSRKFTHPEWDFGVMARINRFFGIGARVEDVQETKRGQAWANVMFEDQDIAYLFGMATFGAAGTKGRSKK